MILNNIDNLYVGSTNALKVYLGSLLIWSLSNDDYDIISTDITSYTGNKSRVYVVDVAKWYMRTIGGNYKEYGIYASSKSSDPYVGELAIENGHEWEYTSNGWVDLGAYSEPEYFLTKTDASNYAIEFGHYWNNKYKMVVDCYFSGSSSADVGPIILRETDRSIFELVQYQNGFYLDFHEPNSTSSPTVDTGDYTTRVENANATQIPKDGTRLRLRLTTTKFVVYDYASGSILYNSGTEGATYNYCTTGKYLTGIWSGSNGNTTAVHSIQIVDASNNLVNNFVVKKRDVSGDNEFYVQDTVSGDVFENMTLGANFTYSQVGTLVRPKAYTAMPAPVDVISTDFSSYTGNADRVYVVDINKWYMRTIGGNYKEYGIYASSKSADPYVGELAIDNGHEWEYTENGWVDLGQYSVLPSGYTELTYVNSQYRNSQTAPYIELNYYPNEDTEIKVDFEPCGSDAIGTLYNVYPNSPGTDFSFTTGTTYTDWRFYPAIVSKKTSTVIQPNTKNKFYASSGVAYINNSEFGSRVDDEDDPEYEEYVNNTSKLRILWSSSTHQNVNLYSFYVRDYPTVMYNFIPCRRDSDGKIGLYNTIDGNFYLPDNEATNPFIAGDVIPYPKEYAVLPSPVDYDIISTNISSYTGSADRVYVTDVNKWYMRTVEGNYKEYGVIATSTSNDAYVGEYAKFADRMCIYMNYGWVKLGRYSILPSGYTELTYVGVRTINSQSPSITLNYYPKEATVIDAKFRPLGEKVVGQLYRAVPNTNTTSFNFIISNGATSQTTYWRFYPTNVKQAVSNIMKVNTDYVFKSTSSGCWLNSKKIWSRTGTYPSQNTSKLVITNNQGDAYYNLYYFNISENNTALYTLVPSLRNIDSKVGLYDTTNNIFYLSEYESTNPYSAGDVIPYPKEYEVLPSPVDVIPTDITSYTGNADRVYVIDVAKWYMRTVGGNYKEYGIYASSKSEDPYVGELAIENGHEWEYTSNGWVDLGAYRLPSGYTELTYVGIRSANYASPYITLDYYPQEATVIDAKFRPLGTKVRGSLYNVYPDNSTTLFLFIIGDSNKKTYWRFYPKNSQKATSDIIKPNNDYVFKSASSGCWLNSKIIFSRTGTYPSQNTSRLRVTNSENGSNFNLYYFNISENNTALYTLVPSLRNIDSKVGLYDTVNDSFYLPDNESTNPYSAGDVIPYPKEYAVLPSPIN